jgi:hypothetical protein
MNKASAIIAVMILSLSSIVASCTGAVHADEVPQCIQR